MVSPPITRIAASFLLSCVFFPGFAAAQTQAIVDWSGDRLSVQASGAPVASVLREVARQTHVQIHGLEKVSGTADVEFADTSLIDGLRVLLEGFNYLMLLNEPAPTVWIHSRVAPDGLLPDQSRSAARADLDPADTSEWHATEDARDQEQEEQIEAADRLKTASAESLLHVIQTGSTAARIAAINALAAQDPQAAADAAATAIDSSDPALSGAAMQILSQIEHASAIETIGGMLRHPNIAVRRAALELLFLRNDPASLPYIGSSVDDPDASFRARAIELMNLLAQSSKER